MLLKSLIGEKPQRVSCALAGGGRIDPAPLCSDAKRRQAKAGGRDGAHIAMTFIEGRSISARDPGPARYLDLPAPRKIEKIGVQDLRGTIGLLSIDAKLRVTTIARLRSQPARILETTTGGRVWNETKGIVEASFRALPASTVYDETFRSCKPRSSAP